MREILFRGKSKRSGGFVYGDLVRKFDTTYIVTLLIDSGTYEYVEIFPETVGQFVGLIDAIGKRIFEGDRIRYIYANRDGVVVWDGYHNKFVFESGNGKEPLNFGKKEFIVLGAIHDQKEEV